MTEIIIFILCALIAWMFLTIHCLRKAIELMASAFDEMSKAVNKLQAQAYNREEQWHD